MKEIQNLWCFCRVHSTKSRELNDSQAAELSEVTFKASTNAVPRVFLTLTSESAGGAVSSFSQEVQQSTATCWPFQQWLWSLRTNTGHQQVSPHLLLKHHTQSLPQFHVLPISVPSTPAHGNVTTCAQQSCCRHTWTCFLHELIPLTLVFGDTMSAPRPDAQVQMWEEIPQDSCWVAAGKFQLNGLTLILIFGVSLNSASAGWSFSCLSNDVASFPPHHVTQLRFSQWDLMFDGFILYRTTF